MIIPVRTAFLFFLWQCLCFSVDAQRPGTNQDSSHLSLIFTGDIMGHGAQIAAALDPVTGEYHYDSCFIYLKPYLDSADITIGNLEVTLAGPPYKGYPQFSSPDGLPVALKNTGFDILVNANNHAADRGAKGALRTIQVLDSLGIPHTGTYRSEKERDSLSPFIIEKNGFRIALLNYTYGINGLPMPLPAVVSLIDTSRIIRDIEKSHEGKVDFIIAFLHWGTEYERVPNSSQKKLAAFLIKRGVNAIIGSHPHVIQPLEIVHSNDVDSLQNRLVVWSMGNLVSNQPERYRNGGIMVKVDLEKNGAIQLAHVACIPVFVYRRNQQDGRHFFLIPAEDWIKGRVPVSIQAAELPLLMEFDSDVKKHIGEFMNIGFTSIQK